MSESGDCKPNTLIEWVNTIHLHANKDKCNKTCLNFISLRPHASKSLSINTDTLKCSRKSRYSLNICINKDIAKYSYKYS